ncbi:MAG: nucleoside triphosphate pyrophosphohydrolase [Armatimonadota bacterium]
MKKSKNKFKQMEEIMARLRAPDGCPWDKAQTHKSLLPFLIEEACEVRETIRKRKYDHLKEELGDLLLQIFFHAQIAKEKKLFDMDGVIDELMDKIVKRHPHIFDKSHKKLKTPEQVRRTWEEIKVKEKNRVSILEGIPKSLPSLLYAQRLQNRASEVGFDWENIDDVIAKMKEEEEELLLSYREKDKKAMKEEIGDLFFALVNVCRFINIDAEEALDLANKKFEKRFKYIEKHAKKEKRNLKEMTLDEMELLWNKAKNR